MFTLKWFWGIFSFALALDSSVLMLSWKLPKKKLFYLKLATCLSIMLAFLFLWRYITYGIIGNNSENYYYISGWYLVFYLIYFLMELALILICFKTDFWTALFCSTIAYSLQHISERSYEIIVVYMGSISLLTWFILLSLITIIIYLAFYFFVVKRIDYTSFAKIVDHKTQVILSVITLATAIFINAEINRLTNDSKNAKEIMCYDFAFSIIVCMLDIILELSLVNAKKANLESQKLQEILSDEKSQYEEEKKNMELLNIKYHDIKHLINSTNPNTDPALYKEIKNSLGLYESSVKTGNEAIDVIISKKSKYCYDNKIKFTCTINGEKLNYISPYELYALFENAIDNAIDACKDCDSEKKVISITQSEKDNFLVINFVNYFTEALTFKKGLPQTHKAGDYHGYGMKSMKMIVEKYDGRVLVNTKDDLFILQIFLPLSSYKKQEAITQ